MSHTPGPWYYHFAACIEEQGTGDYVDATGICNASEEEFMQDGGRGDLVAFVPHDGPHQANARLIAAAPDLLAALIRMRDEFNSYADCPSKCDAVSLAFQAIEKAGGE